MSMKSFSFASRIDLLKAYWQICLYPSERDKLGFFFNRKVLSLNRLPFGLSSSPGIFQRLIDQILSNVSSLVYQDDILILAGNSREEHKQYVLQAIRSLHSHGLVINLEKSTFFDAQCIFLGYKISLMGISPNSKLIQSLKKFHTSKTPYQLRAFRGLFNFLSHNILDSAKLSIHLNEFIGTLPKSRKEIPVPADAQKDILAMKDSMSRIVTLEFPDFSKDFLLMCDASNTGYDSILTQSHAPINDSLNPKQLYPIAVHSRSWDALAHSATPTYYELKSISRSLTFFSPLIRYSRIHVFTDHKNLLRIIMDGSLPIYQKYIFNICNFNCVIKFIEGHNNPVADDLSRSPLEGGPRYSKLHLQERKKRILMICNNPFMSTQNTYHLSK
uniref:Reverse transcriptase domain-containing protein n=1 Tax=Strongyloides venezuelensis TaxID=75913 RepID=A0A0K0FBE1_STRVS